MPIPCIIQANFGVGCRAGQAAIGVLVVLAVIVSAMPRAVCAAEHGQQSGPRATWVAKGTATQQPRGTVQHSRTLATPTRRTGPTVLRWRTPSVSQARPLKITAARSDNDIELLVPANVLDTTRVTIQPVALNQPIPPEQRGVADPFDDPFGDRQQRRPVPAQPLDDVSAEQSVSTPATLVAQPTPARDAALADPPPQPLPEPTPATVNELKPTVSQGCQRVYNQRDCCKEGQRCGTALDKWQHSAISKISLDITPTFRPDEDDLFKEETERDRELSKSPVRTWRDRNNQVLATGRLTNIKRGRLLVLNAQNDVVKLRFDDLSDDDLCFLTSWLGVPTECTLGDEPFAGRHWMPMSFTWKASAVCHKPLYFQETALERYGHTAGPIRQPILSGAHFFMSLVTLPYQAGIDPPWECRYPLGHYRPGNCAPYFLPPVPLSVRGGLLEAGAWIGGIYLIP